MKRIGRRAFLAQSGITAALAAGLAPGCKRLPDREKVLAAIVREVVGPNTSALVGESRRLDDAVGRLAAAPSTEALGTARSAWKGALLAWKHAYSFRNGPIVESNALLRAMFWPARPTGIETVLSSERPIDDRLVDELGADTKGLFALEPLLFARDAGDEAALRRFGNSEGTRTRDFARAIAHGVASCAESAARALGDGTAYAAMFSKGGQESVNRLVNQMADTVEANVAGRLTRVLDLEANRQLKPREVEGWPSGTSQQIALAHLVASEELYTSAGKGRIGDLVRGVAPAIDDRLRETWTKAITLVRALRGPLEEVVATNRPALAAAATASKALEVALKADLAGALGVTLTFTTGDGD